MDPEKRFRMMAEGKTAESGRYSRRISYSLADKIRAVQTARRSSIQESAREFMVTPACISLWKRKYDDFVLTPRKTKYRKTYRKTTSCPCGFRALYKFDRCPACTPDPKLR